MANPQAAKKPESGGITMNRIMLAVFLCLFASSSFADFAGSGFSGPPFRHGTLTDTKICTYEAANGIVCTTDSSGDDLGAYGLDNDLSSVSATDNTVPSAKATKAALDAKAPLADPVFTGSAAIPQGANPTVNAAGEIAVDTTAGQLVYYDNAVRVLPYTYSNQFTIQGYGEEWIVYMWQVPIDITITRISCRGAVADNVAVGLWYSDADGTSNIVNTGFSAVVVSGAVGTDTTGANADVAADKWITAETTSVGGATILFCTIRYTATRK